MSCIKNLGESDAKKWIAAGCPLPAMMGIERRAGKDKPVITKSLVKLDGGMFKCYEAVRRKWAYLDCYQSPGPIQFSGPASDLLNFMVKDPDIENFLYSTDVQEKYESKNKKNAHTNLFRQVSQLSILSRSRIRAPITIPDTLTNGNYTLAGIKKYQPYSQLVYSKIQEQFPNTDSNMMSSNFVEIQDKILTDQGYFTSPDEKIEKLNSFFNQEKAIN